MMRAKKFKPRRFNPKVPPKLKRLKFKGASSPSGLGLQSLGAQSQRNWEFYGTLPERVRQTMPWLVYLTAERIHAGLLERIPAGKAWGTYRSLLKVVRVGPKGWKGGAHAIIAKPKPLKDQAVDSGRTVLYVRPKRNRAVPIGKEVQVLEKHNPWTMETLPFSPKRNEAILITRRVSRGEVRRVTAKRKDDKPAWSAELAKLGVRHVRKDTVPPELKTRTVQDVAFEALRLEFGYGGVRAVPHWRPSVKEALMSLQEEWRRSASGPVSGMVSNPKNSRWKKAVPKVPSIRIADLKRLDWFQKRLKLRFKV